jgi:hypothetical protein
LYFEQRAPAEPDRADPAHQTSEGSARATETVREALKVSETRDVEAAGEPGVRPAKTVDRYLLVGDLAHSKEDFLAVLRYTGQFAPAVGSDEAEARQARHVIILGGVEAISPAVEQRLLEAGCQVQRLERAYARALDHLLAPDRP